MVTYSWNTGRPIGTRTPTDGIKTRSANHYTIDQLYRLFTYAHEDGDVYAKSLTGSAPNLTASRHPDTAP
jgi:hypothetical protein